MPDDSTPNTLREAVLLLTDVVDSTALAERLGDATMATVWAAHDRVARDLLQPWRGREIDKTDGMLLLFDSAHDAAGYALAYHQALGTLPVPLRARAGLHRGPVLLRENAPADVARGAKPLEVDGLAKPTVARVMALAFGGQLLMTPEARDALLASSPDAPDAPDATAGAGPGRSLLSHGHWQLKGLAAPIELFELRADSTPMPAPVDSDKAWRMVRSGERWLPAVEIPNNLPHAATSFVGRAREIDELRQALRSHRLVTLLGMGGLGKTRLSLQVAAETRHLYPEGAWFVDLSALRDPTLVPAEAATVLGLREEPDRTLLQTLAAHLRRQRVLLVLDNCEHLLDAAAELADVLLRAAPGLRVLASSREPLDVPGEQCYPILPLPVPDASAGAEALQRSPAVQLFVARARSHRPDFSLDDRQAAPVAELVTRLEGIPLAIELAAARLRTMEVEAINEGLSRRYEVLTGGSRRLQARQQTLRALVDWSYDLLQPTEQAALQRLAVCAGGFDLAAAQTVCTEDADPASVAAVEGLVGSLTEKSLLMPRPGSTPPRWGMLESIREYALDKLDAAQARADTLARHNAHFFALAKQAREGLKGVEQGAWIARLEAEIDNLRAAAQTALDGGVDPVVAVKIATALQGFWILRGYAGEGRAVVQAALSRPEVQAMPVAHGHALYVAAALAGSQSDHGEARALLRQCLALRRTLGHPVDIAATLSTLAQSELSSGAAAEALVHEAEALALFEAEGQALGQCISHLHLAHAHRRLGDAAAAAAELTRVLALARALGNRELEAEAQRLAATLALEAGDTGTALRQAEAALAVAEDSADRRGSADARRLLAAAALQAGDAPRAQTLLAKALPELVALELREEFIDAAETAARLAAAQQEPIHALRVAAALDKWRLRLGLERDPAAADAWAAWLARTLADVKEAAAVPGGGSDAAEAARAEGQRWDMDAAAAARLLA